MKHTRLLLQLFMLVSILLSPLASAAAPEATAPQQLASAVEPVEKGIVADIIMESKPKGSWSITVGKVLWSVFFLVAAYFIMKYITRFLEAFAERWIGVRLYIKRIVPFIRVLGWTLIIFIIIDSILTPPHRNTAGHYGFCRNSPRFCVPGYIEECIWRHHDTD